MTQKEFKHDMQRGLGSCVVELKNAENVERFMPIVLWGCARDMAYDAQSDGCRSFYLYELITHFADKTPFIDIVEKRLYLCMRSAGWEFAQDCEILECFASDGDLRSWDILRTCYKKLRKILQGKRKQTESGRLPEAENFEHLCNSILGVFYEEKERVARLYRYFVNDMGMLIKNNALYSADSFCWFQAVSENMLGKRMVSEILHQTNASEGIKQYLLSMETRGEMREREMEQRRKNYPRTADEIYTRIKTGEKNIPIHFLFWMRNLMREEKQEEVERLAQFYKNEQDLKLRGVLLQSLTNEFGAWSLEIPVLITDSKSTDTELADRALCALRHRKDARVREYAHILLQERKHAARAVSMLVANYEDEDRELFVNAVKQIPVTYKDKAWHDAFSDILYMLQGTTKNKPKELLFYMYQNTLCSFCREYIVKEMGRRRMLPEELLEELQYDCNQDIREYAKKKMKARRGSDDK